MKSSKPWNKEKFHAAIERKTGAHYSRAHAYATLEKFLSNPPNVVTIDNVPRVAFPGLHKSETTSQPVGKDKLVPEISVLFAISKSAALIRPVEKGTKPAIP